jgi:serine/threonine-protein kinase
VSDALAPGARVGPYVVEAPLGMGGMGAVYCARDARLGRLVALKVVRHGRVDRPGVDPADRLLAEARAAGALRHPHVVQIWDAGIAEDGERYVAMELVDGKSLRAYAGDPTVAMQTRVRWLAEVASALGAAHAAGLVHRDVKPENVMIDRELRARVLDFGIAKRVAFDTAAPTAEEPLHLQTAEGRVIGTAAYMAPEQLAGGAPDPKWDQFAWGVMAYELLTGVHPRQAVPMPGATAHFTQTPRLPSELAPGLPFEVSVAVLRAMAPEAALRFPSMAEIEASLLGARSPAMQGAPIESAPLRRDAAVAPAPMARGEPRAWSPRARAVLALALSLGVAGLGAAALAMALVVRRTSPPSVPEGAVPQVASTTLAPPPAQADSTGAASTTAPASAASDRGGAQDAAPRPLASVAASPPFLTRCQCLGSNGRLCPLNADRSLRSCWCAEGGGQLERAPNSRDFDFRGRGLVEGQPCEGFFNSERRTGTYAVCQTDCDFGGFSGPHRGPCRGLGPSFVEESGRLSCY